MKHNRRSVSAVSLLMAAVTLMTVSVAAPVMSATVTGDDPAVVGAAHRSVSMDGIPFVDQAALQKDISDMFLDKKVQYLDIYGRHQMVVLDGYARSLNGRMDFSSSDTSVASVSSSGMITAVGNGTASITARDKVSGKTLSCMIFVGTAYAPTQAPTVKPTDEPPEPTAAPKPTQPPTQKPTQAPTQAPTTAPVKETLSLNVSSATVYRGNYYHVVATSNTTVSFSSSDTSVATVNSKGIVTALSTGSVTITAKTSTKSAACKLNIISGSSVSLSHTNASVNRYKTFLMTSYTSGVSWSSSDPSIATVEDGFVYGVKAGTAVITASTSKGAATCLMTVNPSSPVRFAYTSPNCAAKNQTVTLICITDTARTAVRFAVETGSGTEYVSATSKTKDEDTYIWKGTTSFSKAGTYSVKAYAQYNGNTKWSTCGDAATTAFVTDSTDMTTTVCANRRASDDVINLISTFEGFSRSAYADILTGDPTLGYGRVVYTGEDFYNTLTKAGAYAYLVQTVNNEGYAARVNSFLVGNKAKFNQQQFDALVCFVYNVGTGPLYSDSELISAILDCSDGSGSQKTYYINGDAVRIRKGAGTSYDIIRELYYGTELTVLSTSNKEWYHVQLSDGTKGYVSSEFISSRSVGGNLDLRYVDKQTFINKLCQYHHANGCIWGLLYRRVDETEMFFYGDYEPDYGYYKYPVSFTCAVNPSFHT